MHSRVVAVFPGSVAIPPGGVLAGVGRRHPGIRAVLADIDAVAAELGASPVCSYLLAPGMTRPQGPEGHYLALMGASLAVFHGLLREGVQPYALVGQDIGELWALVASGALSVRDGARIACARSRALTKLSWNGAMMPVNVGAVRAQRLVELLDHPDLVVGRVDTPQQCVLSGPRHVMPLAARLAGQLGWTGTMPEVLHPAHNPALAPAAVELVNSLDGIAASVARWPVFSPTLRRLVTRDDDPVAITAEAMVIAVHFHEAITALAGRDADVFLECGAREDVAGLVRANVPSATVLCPVAEGEWQPVGQGETDDSGLHDLGQVMRLQLTPAPAPPAAPALELPPRTLLLCGRSDAESLRALVSGRADVHVGCVDTLDWTWLPLTPEHLRVLARPGQDAEFVHEAMFAAAVRFPHLRSIAALVMDAVRDEVPDPVAGLFTGAIRPLAAELADCACVGVAVGGLDLVEAFGVLAAELNAAPPLLSAFYQGPRRLLYELRRARPTPGTLPLDGDSVVVATGGGRGVTASILLALAQQARPRIHVLGRTPLPPDEVTDLPGRADYVRAHLDEHAGVKDAEHAYDLLERGLQVRATLDRLERHCGAGRVHYRRCDITDAAQLGHALAGVERVDLLLHAATELRPASPLTTALEAFRLVRDVKVRGYRNLKAVLADRPPRIWCNFASMGMLATLPGDGDYQAANDYLTCAGRHAAESGAAEFSILWSACSQKTLDREWNASITPDEGVRQFLHALTHYRDHPVVVFLRASERQALAALPHSGGPLRGLQLTPDGAGGTGVRWLSFANPPLNCRGRS
ncbi:acyltransferase domain-containing protein [Nonomuraea sp. NPDC046802]|uniref:acyltransferase domain-containing protein n=1 Tax=Nonomuraea sp. NPDC046802 TaxID=3154919 RepID=UPI0033FA4A8C